MDDRTVKRVIDVTLTVLGLLMLWPLLLGIALVVKLSSRGPVLYGSKRVGKDGQLFTMYKFRSMVAHADQLGPGITGAQDSRITRVGRILRRYKLDELPQLLNVLRGDMSLVGPRPEDPRYVDHYTPAERALLAVPPGVTGIAALTFRQENLMLPQTNWEAYYIEHIMPVKAALELEYLQSRSLYTDVMIILRTLRVVFKR